MVVGTILGWYRLVMAVSAITGTGSGTGHGESRRAVVRVSGGIDMVRVIVTLRLVAIQSSGDGGIVWCW